MKSMHIPSPVLCRALLASLTMALSPMPVLGQGWVEFENFGAVDAPIYDVDSRTLLAGPDFLAQLYAAAPGQSLQPVGVPAPFLSGEYAGYFQGNDYAIPGVPPFATAVVQVVAWRASDGATFKEANHLGGHVGESPHLTLVLGDVQLPSQLPAPLTGLQSFSLHVVVPEPSAFALGLLGGAVLALGRRWRRCRERTKLALSPP